MTRGPRSKFLSLRDWLLVSLGTATIVLAISNASLWIDEGYSGMLASQLGFREWAHALNALAGSDSQLPGYYLYLWIWSRIFGVSGLAIRFANVPWILVFVVSLAWISKHLLKTQNLWLIGCLSPFVWFYANEARPYMIIIAISTAILTAVLAYTHDPVGFQRTPWFIVAATLLLWFSHMLTITVVPSLLIMLGFLLPKPLQTHRIVKDWAGPILALLPLYLLLAGYYIYTLISKRGGVLETPGLGNLAFAIYEFLGLDGLGPPRSLLRSGSLRSLLPALTGLVPGIAAISFAGWVAISQWAEPDDRRERVALLSSFTFGIVLLFGLAHAAHFRILGRHMAVFFPFFLVLLLAALKPNGETGPRRASAVALATLAIAWIASDGRQRLMGKYQKDDYRDAVAVARRFQKDGYKVLWLADIATARYYGLETTRALQESVVNSDLVAAAGDCYPEHLLTELHKHKEFLVVFTDRASYDPTGQCRRIVESERGEQIATFNDFEIWRLAR